MNKRHTWRFFAITVRSSDSSFPQDLVVIEDTISRVLGKHPSEMIFGGARGTDTVVFRDIQATKAMYLMLAEAVAGVTKLTQALGAGLSGASMGGSFPPDRWKDMSPEEIFLDFRNLVAIDGIGIQIQQAKIPGSRTAEARQLSQQVRSLNKKLRNKIGSARAWIKKHRPGSWTENEDEPTQELL